VTRADERDHQEVEALTTDYIVEKKVKIEERVIEEDNESKENGEDKHFEVNPTEMTNFNKEIIGEVPKKQLTIDETAAAGDENGDTQGDTPIKTTRRTSKIDKEKLKARNGLEGAQRRLSRSNSPPTRARRLSHAPQHVYIKTTPAIPSLSQNFYEYFCSYLLYFF
jgi:hypothetical protein